MKGDCVWMNGVYRKMKMEKVNTTVALLEAILGDFTHISDSNDLQLS